jgi:NAD(P)-dependent dehydrogenase (short-subunit alcohol dehydrogenase family)
VGSGLLEGKVALIAGAGPGLGADTAHVFAHAGAKLVVSARNLERLEALRAEIEKEGGEAIAVSCDVTDAAQREALVERTLDTYGALDVVVHNGFSAHEAKPTHEIDLDTWRQTYEVNVFGALELTQLCVPHLQQAVKERGDAAFVFVLTMAMRKPRAKEGGYASSKSALMTAMRTLALELAPSRVRVNGVAPGWIAGPSVEGWFQWEASRRSCDPAEVRAEIAANIPLGEIPSGPSIADPILFLASPMARSMTGQTVDVNGGEYM